MKRNFKRWLTIGTTLVLGLLIGWALLRPTVSLPQATGVVPDERSIEPHDGRPISGSSPIEIQHATPVAVVDLGKGSEADADQAEESAADPGGLAWRMLHWQDENDQIPPGGLLRARDQLAVLQRKPSINQPGPLQPDALGAWNWLGPGNIGGRIRSILIDPANPSRMWVGSVSGGIWTTADAGANWQPVNDFLASLAVSALVMDPTDTNILYAGTGEGFWGGTGSPSGISGVQGGRRLQKHR